MRDAPCETPHARRPMRDAQCETPHARRPMRDAPCEAKGSSRTRARSHARTLARSHLSRRSALGSLGSLVSLEVTTATSLLARQSHQSDLPRSTVNTDRKRRNVSRREVDHAKASGKAPSHKSEIGKRTRLEVDQIHPIIPATLVVFKANASFALGILQEFREVAVPRIPFIEIGMHSPKRLLDHRTPNGVVIL